MKIVLTTKGAEWDSKMDARFGRTEYLFFYDEEKDEINTIDNRSVANEAHGVGPKTAQILFDNNPDILITGNGPGGNAATILEKGSFKIYVGAGDMTVKAAYEAYKSGELKEF